MSRKEPSPRTSSVPNAPKIPPPPPTPPPCRAFKQTFFSGFAETKESKQKTWDWKNYIRGYGEGFKAGRYNK